MKKFVIGSIAAASIAVSTMAPAFANVVRPTGATTGRPVASVSNAGSAQGQASRSATGTTSKITNDGLKVIWIP